MGLVAHQRAAPLRGHREERVRREIADGRARLVHARVLALHLLDELLLPLALVALHVRARRAPEEAPEGAPEQCPERGGQEQRPELAG